MSTPNADCRVQYNPGTTGKSSVGPVSRFCGANAIRRSQQLVSFALAEESLRGFLVALDYCEVFPAPWLLPDTTQSAAVIPWRRGGRVWIDDERLSDDNYGRVWRQGRHRLLLHVGGWSGAVVDVAVGNIIVVPSLSPRTWDVGEEWIDAACSEPYPGEV